MAAMDLARKKGPVIRTAKLLWRGLNHLLWPAVCLNCAEHIGPSDNGLCRDCWDALMRCTGGDYCGRCGRDASRFALVDAACPDCRSSRFNFDGLARSGVYSGSLKDMILAFKKDRTQLDNLLGFLGRSALAGAWFRDEIEVLVPVPLHWSRRLSRGYNQSAVLAAKLNDGRLRIDTDLVRIRRTRFQPTMASAAARARNVAGAFAVRRGHRFGGRVVCLVDDIKTSGATLNECARTLKQAGAAKVFGLVLAVAGQGAA